MCQVTKFQVGDQLGVGCLVDSCLECAACRAGEEENCERAVFTYQSDDWSGRAAPYPATRTVDGQVEKSPLLGGYSTKIVALLLLGWIFRLDPFGYPSYCLLTCKK